jgi:hypothetical protein
MAVGTRLRVRTPSSSSPPHRPQKLDNGADHSITAAKEGREMGQKGVIRPTKTGVRTLKGDEDENDEDEKVATNDVDGDSTSQDDATELAVEHEKDGPVPGEGSAHEEKNSMKELPGAVASDRAASNLGPKSKRTTRRTKTEKMSNPLTKLIPGYTAPMMLNTSSLDKFRPEGGITELQKRAERTDASTKDFVVGSTSKHTSAMRKTSQGFLPKSYTEAYSSFKKGVKRAPDNTAGKGWFGMTPTPMTEELKTDLAVIRNRGYLDPKRFYKSADKHHKIVQVGTVIEGPSEYYSSRLTKKQRRSNITEEIMADPASADYAKNKFKQMSREKTLQAQKRQLKPKRVKKFY